MHILVAALAAVLVLSLGFSLSAEPEVIQDISTFPLDERGALSAHWLIYPEGKCASVVESKWSSVGGDIRKQGRVSGELEKHFFDNEKSRAAISFSADGCPVICLNKGTPKEYILTPPEYMIYSGKRDSIKFLNAKPLRIQVSVNTYTPTSNLTDSRSPITLLRCVKGL